MSAIWPKTPGLAPTWARFPEAFADSRDLEPGISPGDHQHPMASFSRMAKPLTGKVAQRGVVEDDPSCDGLGAG
jgi:hypothetical protein